MHHTLNVNYNLNMKKYILLSLVFTSLNLYSQNELYMPIKFKKAYTKDKTALLVIDPLNDLISEGGIAWRMFGAVIQEVKPEFGDF